MTVGNSDSRLHGFSSRGSYDPRYLLIMRRLSANVNLAEAKLVLKFASGL